MVIMKDGPLEHGVSHVFRRGLTPLEAIIPEEGKEAKVFMNKFIKTAGVVMSYSR